MMRWPAEKPIPRSLLFVPGNAPEKLGKALKYNADGLIFDLEDAIPEIQKAEARHNVREALKEPTARAGWTLVRINGYSTPYWEKDIEAVTAYHPQGLLLPKCDSADHVEAVASIVEKEERKAGLTIGSIYFFLLVESPRGLIEIPRLAEASSRVVALAFGAEDFCLEMEISRTKEGSDLLFARSHMAIVARAFGCVAIDSVYTDFHDMAGLIRESKASKLLGFSGKLAIHPKQLEAIHAAFSPSKEALAAARKIVDAFEKAQTEGKGVVVLEGKMIDQPVVERARRLLNFSPLQDPKL